MNRALTTFLCCSVLAACAVGPDFKRPDAPKTDRYTKDAPVPTAGADVPGGAVQRFAAGRDIPAEWWKLFHSDALNTLVTEALRNNPDVDSAQAALRAARENVYAQEGAYYPSVSGSFTPTRQKTPAILQPNPASGALVYNLFTAQVNVSYAPDVFGLNRRTVESLNAQAEAQRFALEATNLTLTSNVVAAAIQEASLREQIKATQKTIDVEKELLDLLKRQQKLGQTSDADAAAQETALAQAQLALPPLTRQLAQARDQLTALLGKLPGEEPADTFELSGLALPEELPLSLPAKLVEQRPDIRAAEENLHAASANIGVAVANRLPDITLDAGLGSSALALSKLFSAGTGFWSLAGGITQPLFDGGTLMHKERAARAEFDQAAAQYRSTVVAAFQNVADTLHALASDADALKAAVNAERAAERSLELSRAQLRLGEAAYITVLNAEQAYQQAVIGRAQAQANRYADTAALFQALGGGWWNRPETPKEDGKAASAAGASSSVTP